MSRNARMALYMLGIIVWMGLLGLIVYEAGSLAAHSFIGTGANASLQKWQGLYRPLVLIMASISALITISWCALTEWGFSVQGPWGVGKRTVWAIMGIALAVLSFVVPYVYAAQKSALTMSPMIPVIFVILFVLAGYWISTIFATSAAYKYTPLFSSQIRRHKGGRN
ncbi:MAG: hypothetical protein II137_02365 [Anaerovibrio sp.]|nr:hypothetical protein [Anaerovibrio sp.]